MTCTCSFHTSTALYINASLQSVLVMDPSFLWHPVGRTKVKLSRTTAGRDSVSCLRTFQRGGSWLVASSPDEGRSPDPPCHPAVAPTDMHIITVLSRARGQQLRHTQFSLRLYFENVQTLVSG